MPGPHFDSNIFGTFATTGSRNAFASGVITVMPAALNVSTSVPSCLMSSAFCHAMPFLTAVWMIARSAGESPCPARQLCG